MITPAQCRAARGLLDWKQLDLAREAGVGVVTIRHFEGGANTPRRATLEVIQRGSHKLNPSIQDGAQVGLQM
jgi:transcriptional regulator with XRE-family HTH domain